MLDAAASRKTLPLADAIYELLQFEADLQAMLTNIESRKGAIMQQFHKKIVRLNKMSKTS